VTSEELAGYLRVLREQGVGKAHVSFGFGAGTTVIAVTFATTEPATTPFVTKDGKPVSLDEGMPDLADEDAMAKIHERNFPRSK
jgi:hypothetical protein